MKWLYCSINLIGGNRLASNSATNLIVNSMRRSLMVEQKAIAWSYLAMKQGLHYLQLNGRVK